MALDAEIKTQLSQYLALIESDIVFQANLGTDENSKKSEISLMKSSQ